MQPNDHDPYDAFDDRGTSASHVSGAQAGRRTVHEPVGPVRNRPSRALPIILAAAGAAVIVLVLALTFLPQLRGDEGLVFEIPAGARASVEVPTIDSAISIPTKILFRAGEPAVITIHNRDIVPHRAGPFVVGAGQTLVQRFPEPGEYPIACSVDPLESIVVTVEEY
jgi:hypothetical protein